MRDKGHHHHHGHDGAVAAGPAVHHPTDQRKKLKRVRMKITRKLHKAVEISLYALLVTGLIITEYTVLPWSVTRWALETHIIAALVLFPLIIIVFWAAHRGHLKWSRKPSQRRTGRFIELGLLIMFLCGLWLLFIGENKTQIGNVAHVVHLVTAIPLVLLILWHSWRFSLMKKILTTFKILTITFIMMNTPQNVDVFSGQLTASIVDTHHNPKDLGAS